MRITYALTAIALICLSGCSSAPREIHNKDSSKQQVSESPSKAANEANATTTNQSSFSLSNRKLLEIIDEQSRFFSQANNKSIMSAADTSSAARRIQSLWEEYLITNPNDVEALIIYGKFRRAIGDADTAYMIFKDADSINPNLAVVKQQLCTREAESGMYEEAYGHIRDAVRLEPKNPVYHTQLAQLIMVFRQLMISDGKHTQKELDAEMLAAYKKAFELTPNDREAKWRYAAAFYEVGKADWNAALKLWEEIVADSTFDFERQTALINKARVLMELRRDAEAESILKSIRLEGLAEDKAALLYEIEKSKKTEELKTPPEKQTSGQELPHALKKDFIY